MADIKTYPLARHLRGTSTMHVRHLRRGSLIHDGTALSFFYRPLSAVLSEVPVDDRELPLVFHARTIDFQDLAVQASVTFRVTDPSTACARIDFSLDPDTGRWRGTPLEQVAGLLTETAQQQVLGLVTRALGEANAAAEAARVAAYRDLPQASLLGLAAKDLAGNLPQIGALVLAPDLLAPLLSKLAADPAAVPAT